MGESRGPPVVSQTWRARHTIQPVSTTALLQRVRRHVARHDLWAAGGRIVVALSGGADSVALLLLLHGGPGATHEYFECLEAPLTAAGVL